MQKYSDIYSISRLSGRYLLARIELGSNTVYEEAYINAVSTAAENVNPSCLIQGAV